METTISLTVRDVYNYLSKSENSSQIFQRTKKKFIRKYPALKHIAEKYLIKRIDELEKHLSIDYFELIIWNDLTFEQKLDFFKGCPDENISYQTAYEFKKFYIQSLQDDLNTLINELTENVKFFSPLELKRDSQSLF